MAKSSAKISLVDVRVSPEISTPQPPIDPRSNMLESSADGVGKCLCALNRWELF